MAIPVCIVTGFLGSGKTTLLRELLPLPALRGAAVIVNEFGEVGIDHDLVAESSDEVISLPNGCICCSVKGELSDTLDQLYRRRQAGKIGALDRVIIETTGLANPVPIQRLLTSDLTLRGRFKVAGVVSVVDAVNGLATLDKWDESIRQVAAADWVQISKTDLADQERVAEVTTRIREINPGARVSINRKELSDNPDVMFAQGEAIDWLQRYTAIGSGTPAGMFATPKKGGHLAGVRSFSLTHDQPISLDGLELFLTALQNNFGERLLRFKGLVNTIEQPHRPAVVHGAQSLFHDISWLNDWPSDDTNTRLVFITLDVAQEDLQDLFYLAVRMAR